MRKMYFLRNLNQPVLVVEFRQGQFATGIIQIMIVVLLLKHFYSTCLWRNLNSLQWLLGISIFFQGNLKGKLSPESLYGKIAGFSTLCGLSVWEIWWVIKKKLKPVQFIQMINWFAVFKPVKYDTMCARYIFFPQSSIMDMLGFFTGGRKRKTKTIVLKRNDPLKKVQVLDLGHQSGNFSNHGNPASRGLFRRWSNVWYVVCGKRICLIISSSSMLG